MSALRGGPSAGPATYSATYSATGPAINSATGAPALLVSVVVPTRNRPLLLAEALSSVLAQTYTNVEVIVVDDGSDQPVSIDHLPQHPAVPLRLVRLAGRKGAAAARNAGIRMARGELIAFLDDDDCWEPGKVACQVAYLASHPEVGAVSCWHAVVDERGAAQYPRAQHYRGPEVFGRRQVAWMLFPRSFSLVMLRRSVIGDDLLLDERFPSVEDWDLWMRCSRRGPIAVLPETLCRVRVHDQGRLSDRSSELRGLEAFARKHWSSLSKAERCYLRAHQTMLTEGRVMHRLAVLRSLVTSSAGASVLLVTEQLARLLGRLLGDPGLVDRVRSAMVGAQ